MAIHFVALGVQNGDGGACLSNFKLDLSFSPNLTSADYKGTYFTRKSASCI